MQIIIQFLKRVYRILYWRNRNWKDGLKIKNYSISPKSYVGKKTRIRNKTEIGNISLGDYSYISGPRSYIEEAKIGKYCSIARQVVIGVSGHKPDWVTTSPIITSKTYGLIDNDKSVLQKNIPIIGNDVWIGMNAIIMRGVVIGDGAIIAAGAIVTSNVKPYSIVGGIPATHIRFRFKREIIDSLLEIQWWNWPDQKIKDNMDLFYNVEAFVKKHQKEITN